MAPAATEFGREFFYGRGQEFVRREFFEDLDHVIFRANETNPLRLGGFELEAQNSARNPEELTAVIQIELRRNLGKQAQAFPRQLAVRGVGLHVPEDIGEVPDEADFVAIQQWEEVFDIQREKPKNKLPLVGRHDFGFRIGVQNHNLALYLSICGSPQNTLADSSLDEHKGESRSFAMPFLLASKAYQSQCKVILSQHLES